MDGFLAFVMGVIILYENKKGLEFPAPALSSIFGTKGPLASGAPSAKTAPSSAKSAIGPATSTV